MLLVWVHQWYQLKPVHVESKILQYFCATNIWWQVISAENENTQHKLSLHFYCILCVKFWNIIIFVSCCPILFILQWPVGGVFWPNFLVIFISWLCWLIQCCARRELDLHLWNFWQLDLNSFYWWRKWRWRFQVQFYSWTRYLRRWGFYIGYFHSLFPVLGSDIVLFRLC